MVLLRTPAGFQPRRGAPIPEPSGIAAAGSGNDQPPSRRGSTIGIRGGGLWTAQFRSRRRYPAGERPQEERHPPGNWLTAEQARSLWQAPETDGMKGKRDRAMLALMVACGLRRHGVVSLRAEDLQQREEHWAIVDLAGKAGHIRTV